MKRRLLRLPQGHVLLLLLVLLVLLAVLGIIGRVGVAVPEIAQLSQSLSQVKSLVRRSLGSIFTPVNLNLVNSVLFGVQNSADVPSVIKDNGIYFLLSISSIKFLFLQQFVMRLQGKISRKLLLLICTLVSVSYFLMADSTTVSSLRALIIVNMRNISGILGRRYYFGFSLALCIGILWLTDQSLFAGVGFWLMVSSLLSLHYLLSLIKKSFPVPRGKLFDIVLASFVIWLAVTPIDYLAFGEVSLVSLLASMTVLPFLSVLFVIVIPAIAVTSVSSEFGGWVFGPLNLLVNGFMTVQETIHNLYVTLNISNNFVIVMYLGCLAVVGAGVIYRNRICKRNVF